MVEENLRVVGEKKNLDFRAFWAVEDTSLIITDAIKYKP